MDLISRALEAVRVRTPLISQLNASQDCTIDMQHAEGAPFHFVVRGSIDLILGSERYRLTKGDMAMLPRWDRYFVKIGRGAVPRTIVDVVKERALPLWNSQEGVDTPLSINIGEPPHGVCVLSGIVGFAPQEAGLTETTFPPIIVFRGDERLISRTLAFAHELLLMEINKSEPGFSAVAARSLELFCVQILREWLVRSPHPQGLARGINDAKIRRALEAIYASPGTRWTLDGLAKISGQSRSSFADAFLKAMGETPFQHLRGIRLRMAANQLRTGAKSVEQLASELGYASGTSLVRAFRAQFGATASEFRTQCRKS